MDIRKLVEDTDTTILAFLGDGTAKVLWSSSTSYQVGDAIVAIEAQTQPNGLDGAKVQLLDGVTYILDYQEATKSRPAHYRTRCHTHRLNLDGTSQCRAKYNINRIVKG